MIWDEVGGGIREMKDKGGVGVRRNANPGAPFPRQSSWHITAPVIAPGAACERSPALSRTAMLCRWRWTDEWDNEGCSGMFDASHEQRQRISCATSMSHVGCARKSAFLTFDLGLNRVKGGGGGLLNVDQGWRERERERVVGC